MYKKNGAKSNGTDGIRIVAKGENPYLCIKQLNE
ncbi:hypothetical protein SAMN06298214_1581 [Bacteroidales bacterium WCE2004]|nr:hypothetical protein SAMN06298214_1581 [Bacteroidales bacterium WCE2004]